MKRVLILGTVLLWIPALGCGGGGGGVSDTGGTDAFDVPDGGDVSEQDVQGDEGTVTDPGQEADPGQVVDPGQEPDPGQEAVTCTPPQVSPEYVGSEKCISCHQGITPDVVNAWKSSGHRFKLNEVVDGKPPVYPDFVPKWYDDPDFELLPGLGLTWNDIAYVIGGYGWKARFIGKDGYIITGDADHPGVQYNLETKEWVAYHTGDKKPYTCGGCHTTGWVDADPDCPPDPAMPGFLGVYSETAVACEACHGPGNAHADSGDPTKIQIDEDVCKNCHVRGDDLTKIPASNGLIRHHEQYQELAASPHGGKLKCTSCHSPHASTKYDAAAPGAGVEKECTTCHSDKTIEVAAMAGLECADCHMPKVSKSAVTKTVGDITYGDVHTHLFKLTLDPDATLTYKDADGKEWGNNAVPVIYACKRCHTDWDAAKAIEEAPKVHGEGGE